MARLARSGSNCSDYVTTIYFRDDDCAVLSIWVLNWHIGSFPGNSIMSWFGVVAKPFATT